MSDKYFNEAQRKILTVHDGDYIAKGMVRVAREIYDEAQALKPSDPRLSDDPLTALAAVMRRHDMRIYSPNYIAIANDTEDLFVDEGGFVKADDIKPEKYDD